MFYFSLNFHMKYCHFQLQSHFISLLFISMNECYIIKYLIVFSSMRILSFWNRQQHSSLWRQLCKFSSSCILHTQTRGERHMRLDIIMTTTRFYFPYLAPIHLFTRCSKLLLCISLSFLTTLIISRPKHFFLSFGLFFLNYSFRNCFNPIWREDNKMWTLFQRRVLY